SQTGQNVHPHVIAGSNQSDIGRVVIDTELNSHCEISDRSVGERPVEHPGDSDQETGEGPPPDKSALVGIEIDSLAAQQGNRKNELRRARLYSYPFAGADQSASSLNCDAGMDVPATWIA